jgi:hypothetical protein
MDHVMPFADPDMAALEAFQPRAVALQAERQPHEEARIQSILDALPDPRYADALEIGAPSWLTRKLALRCARLTLAPTARAGEAARLLSDAPNVQIDGAWIGRSFNLIVVSDALTALASSERRMLAEQVAAALAPEGQIVLAHWLSERGRVSGDAAAAAFIAAVGDSLLPILRRRTPHFRVDVLERA